MSKFKPIGKWIWVESRTGGKTTTEAGIIYNEIIKNKHIWGEVVAVGESITEDILVGDLVYWDRTQNKGQGYGGKDGVHEDWISLVDR